MVGEVAKPAYSLSAYPKSRSLSSRAVLTVSRNLRNNEIRIWLTHNFRAEPHTRQLARPEIFDYDVAVRGEARKSVVEGKRVSVRVDPGGRRILKKQQ